MCDWPDHERLRVLTARAQGFHEISPASNLNSSLPPAIPDDSGINLALNSMAREDRL